MHTMHTVGVRAWACGRSKVKEVLVPYEGGVDSTCTRRVGTRARSAGHAPQGYLLSKKGVDSNEDAHDGRHDTPHLVRHGMCRAREFQDPKALPLVVCILWAGMHTLVPHHPIIPQGASADRLGMVRSRVADLENLPPSLTFFRFGYGALCVTRLILPNLQFVQYVRTYHTQRPAVTHTHTHK